LSSISICTRMRMYISIGGQGNGNVVGLYNLECDQYAYVQYLEQKKMHIFLNHFILFWKRIITVKYILHRYIQARIRMWVDSLKQEWSFLIYVLFITWLGFNILRLE
jgi:hypothetical protein